MNSLTAVSNQVNTLRSTLENVANQGTQQQPPTRNTWRSIKTELTQLKGYFADSKYEGKTLIGNVGGTAGFGNVTVVRNEVGGTYGIATFGGSAFAASLALNSTTSTTTAAAALLTAGRDVHFKKLNLIGSQLNAYGAAQNYVSNQITFNNDKVDALNSGLGSLIDADLAKESAQLTALQIKQQLGVQSLSLANQAPTDPAVAVQVMAAPARRGSVPANRLLGWQLSGNGAGGQIEHVDTGTRVACGRNDDRERRADAIPHQGPRGADRKSTVPVRQADHGRRNKRTRQPGASIFRCRPPISAPTANACGRARYRPPHLVVRLQGRDHLGARPRNPRSRCGRGGGG